MADSPKVPLRNLPNAVNWVEKYGALQPHAMNWIYRAAEHLKGKGMPDGQAIATAVNAAKKLCSTGDLNWPGLQQANAGSRAQACAAVAKWEAAKARAHTNLTARAAFTAIDLCKVRVMSDRIELAGPGVAERRRLARQGKAMAGGSYPIRDRADLAKAIRAVGRGKGSHPAIRRHIIKRARQMGASHMIPGHWRPDGTVNMAAAPGAVVDLAWDAALHPRAPAGGAGGGQFAAGGSAGGATAKTATGKTTKPAGGKTKTATKGKATKKLSPAQQKAKLLAAMTPAQQAAYHERFQLRKAIGAPALGQVNQADKKALAGAGLLGKPHAQAAQHIARALTRLDTKLKAAKATPQARTAAIRSALATAILHHQKATTTVATVVPAKPSKAPKTTRAPRFRPVI